MWGGGRWSCHPQVHAVPGMSIHPWTLGGSGVPGQCLAGNRHSGLGHWRLTNRGQCSILSSLLPSGVRWLKAAQGVRKRKLNMWDHKPTWKTGRKGKLAAALRSCPSGQMGHAPLLPWLGVWRPPWSGRAAWPKRLSSWLSGSPNSQGRVTSWPVGSEPRVMRLASGPGSGLCLASVPRPTGGSPPHAPVKNNISAS